MVYHQVKRSRSYSLFISGLVLQGSIEWNILYSVRDSLDFIFKVSIPFHISNTMSIFEVKWSLNKDGMACMEGKGVDGFLLQAVENVYDCLYSGPSVSSEDWSRTPPWIPKSSDAQAHVCWETENSCDLLDCR